MWCLRGAIAGRGDLFTVVEDEAHRSRDDIPPVRTVARTAGQRLERIVEVRIGSE
jgi:hypothetical protein